MGFITAPKIKCADCTKFKPVLLGDRDVGIEGFGTCPKRPSKAKGSVQRMLNGNIVCQSLRPNVERYCIDFDAKAGGQ